MRLPQLPWNLSKPASLLVTAGFLVCLTVFIWQHRFQATEGSFRYDLNTLVAYNRLPGEPTQLDLTPSDVGSPSHIDLRLPDASSISLIHTSFRLRAANLVRGEKEWDDGRLTIEWLSVDTDAQTVYLSSADGNRQGNCPAVVTRPRKGPATPVIRLAHYGTSGTVTLEALEVFRVKPTQSWRVGRWVLLAAWLCWAAWIAGAFGQLPVKAWLAAALWLGMLTQVAVPGPWQHERPMGEIFNINLPPAYDQPPPTGLRAPTRVPPLADVPEPNGSLLLQAKTALKPLRPILHLALFFAPTVGFLMLTSRSSALLLAGSMAIATELAQLGFGFGFDLSDFLDLVTNSLGIIAALITYGMWRNRSPSHGETLPI